MNSQGLVVQAFDLVIAISASISALGIFEDLDRILGSRSYVLWLIIAFW